MQYSMRDITEGVCIRFGLSMDQMRGVNARRCYSRPRQIAMFLCREMTGQSLPQIGSFMCRDHTTVLYATREIARQIAKDPNMEAAVESCRAIIRHRTPMRLEAILKLTAEPLVRAA